MSEKNPQEITIDLTPWVFAMLALAIVALVIVTLVCLRGEKR